jgi:hypothetical protein
LFYPEETYDNAPKTFEYLSKMYAAVKNNSNHEYIYHENAYPAMFATIRSTYGELFSPEDHRAAFDQMCDDNCSLVVFESWDQEFFDINEYFYQVSNIYLRIL